MNAASPGRRRPGRGECVQPPHGLSVEAEPGRETEAAPVHRTERDAPRLFSSTATATARAAATGSRGSPSARGNTLVPPPGRNPIGVAPSAPFSASLYVPSPENTTIASMSAAEASAASRSHARTLRELRRQDGPLTEDAATSEIRRPVTCVEYGLTIRSARFTLPSMPRRTALIVEVPEAEPAVGELRLQHDSSPRWACPRTSRSSSRSRMRQPWTRAAGRSLLPLPGVRLQARPRRALRRWHRLAPSGAVAPVRRPDLGGRGALARPPSL